MFEIVFPHEINNSLSTDDHYLIAQTMRMTNQIKMFYLAAEDIRRYAPDNRLTYKKYDDLMLQHAANLYEVIFRLFDGKNGKSIYERYEEALKDERTLKALDALKRLFESNDKEVHVLEAIRIKHAAHIATDNFYVWQSISDSPTTRDLRVGIGETTKESDWFFMMDTSQIYDHIGKNILGILRPQEDANPEDGQVQIEVLRIITDYTKRLITLFQAIGTEIFKGKFVFRELPA